MKLLTVTPPPPPPAAAVVMCLLIMLLWLDFAQLSTARRTNVLLLLADDLGYGDINVRPYQTKHESNASSQDVLRGIYTPHLQQMASEGVVLTNYHTAAATCTPTRASILTGLYPWRLGIKGVFEYGPSSSQSAQGQRNSRHGGNRDDWLLRVSSIASVFREHHYRTFHSGKVSCDTAALHASIGIWGV